MRRSQITSKEKQELKDINTTLSSMDDEMKTYILGYIHGLQDRKVASIIEKTTQ